MAHYRATVNTRGHRSEPSTTCATSAVRVAGDNAGVGAAYDVAVGGIGRDQILRCEIVAIDSPRRIEARAETRTLLSVGVVTVDADGMAAR